MSDFQAIPIISDQQAVRVDPFAKSQASSRLSTSLASARGAAPSGVNQFGSGVVDSATSDGELDAEEVSALQQAAADGDEEAFDFLNQLGIPLGVAAAAVGGGVGAVRGGLALTDALMKNRGQGGMFPDQGRTTPMTMPPSRRLTGPVPVPTPVPEVQGRVPGPAPITALEDHRLPYEVNGGKLPIREQAGAALRKAAQAARRVR